MRTFHNNLMHYGVLGMKWGVRRYQDKGRTRTGIGKEPSKVRSKSEAFVRSKSNQTLSTCEAGVTAESVVATITSLAVIGGLIGVGLGKERRERKKQRDLLETINRDKEIKSFKDAPRLSKKMSPGESMKLTNPDFPNEGSTMNCACCTMAMVLREKGYDVKASKSEKGWYTDDLFKAAFNSTQIKVSGGGIIRSSKNMMDALASNGDGAYGSLGVKWHMGGGHSLFWKNENGKTHIYDGQSGEELTKSIMSEKSFTDKVDFQSVHYNRLDNCSPTEYALAVVESNKK